MIKAFAFAALEGLGINAALRRYHRGRIKVLMYHNITPGAQHFGNAIDPAEFRQHLQYLRRHCNLVSIDQNGAWVGLRGDRLNVLLTFDDGFINNLYHALPVLRSEGASAVFFVIAQCLADGSPPHFAEPEGTDDAARAALMTITAADARTMLAAGMTIGSHSLAHADHRAMNEADMLAQAAEARAAIELALAEPVALYALPWGYFNAGQPQALARSHARVFLTRHGFCGPEDSVIPRNEVANLAHLKVAVSGALDMLLALIGRRRNW